MVTSSFRKLFPLGYVEFECDYIKQVAGYMALNLRYDIRTT